MGTLKGYVHNKARPEGCIAERYIDKECLMFCSMYLGDSKTIFNKGERNDEIEKECGELSVFSCKGRPFGGPKHELIEKEELARMHICVLNNCYEIDDYVIDHKQSLELESSVNIDQRHDREFPLWFKNRVLNGNLQSNEEIRSLAIGPDDRIRRYTGCMVNGFRFHVQERERDRKTQNSGVMVQGDHGNNTLAFYGVIKDIFEVEYLLGRKKVLLFKCDWWKLDGNSGLQIDKDWGTISVNISRKWYQDQPYVLADQVQQVFYVPDMKLGKNWYVVESFSPRNSYDVPEQSSNCLNEEFHQEDMLEVMIISSEWDEEVPPLVRGEPQRIVKTPFHDHEEGTSRRDVDFINDDEDVEISLDNNDNEDEELWDDSSTNSG